MARITRRMYVGVAAALAVASAAYAAGIEAQARKDYGRVRFTFGTPTSMRATTSGTTATLSFSAPVSDSPEAIAAGLPDYVKGATLSADKKTLTLTLAKPYRIRQFTSGNQVGLDLIDRGESAPKTAPVETTSKPIPDAAMLTTKKPVAAPEKATPEKKKPEKPKPPALVPKPPTKETAILTTKAPVKPEPEKPTADVLTTKATPEAEVTLPSTHVAPAEPAPIEQVEPKTPAPQKEEVKPAQTKAAPDTTAFKAAISTSSAGTDLSFPWKERTAAAVFKRGHDIWIVFSRFADVGAKQLSASLPKNIVQMTQYGDANNTILRLVTDGSLNARIIPATNGFAWKVNLSANTVAPHQDVSLSVDSLESAQRLILGVYDIAPAARFIDPAVGDQLVIVPAYEVGRGVAATKNFPQLSLLATAQGVAIVSQLPDLKIDQTRAGTILSAEGGLAVSESLPTLVGKAPVSGNATSTGVMLPYDQWYVPPEKYLDTLHERLHAIATAGKVDKPDRLLELAKLYLSNGMGQEAHGVLAQIREQFPQYYGLNRLALLSGVAAILSHHMDVAANDLAAPELNDSEEAGLWRQVAGLYAPPVSEAQKLQDAVTGNTATSDSASNASTAIATPEAAAAIKASKPGFQFLKYSRPYIRFYPPRIRQKLATIAADAYLADSQEEKALAVYDTLMHDDILAPLKQEAEFALAAVAAKKGEVDQAIDAYDRVAKQTTDPRSAARARYASALLYYQKGKMGADEAVEKIEGARMSWRGDAIERAMLKSLIDIYTDSKRYDDVLRTQKTILDAFPSDPETLAITTDMSTLFRRVFLEGLGDEMDPLKALSLFYEFRDLTPLADEGDQMIQKLADRLAALDLIDRAAGLLDNQIKFRAKGEARARIGARLALLHLLNKNPQEALNILQVTNFGSSTAELQTTRLQLLAEALNKLDKHEEALGVLYNDVTPAGAALRLDILWAMRDWPNVANRAEDMLSARPNLTDPLTMQETEVLLKLALAYTFEGDYTQLRYLRDYYSGLIPDTAYKQMFDFITNDTTPLDPEDFNLLTQQISRTEGFLDMFKTKIAAGKLSEAVK